MKCPIPFPLPLTRHVAIMNPPDSHLPVITWQMRGWAVLGDAMLITLLYLFLLFFWKSPDKPPTEAWEMTWIWILGVSLGVFMAWLTYPARYPLPTLDYNIPKLAGVILICSFSPTLWRLYLPSFESFSMPGADLTAMILAMAGLFQGLFYSLITYQLRRAKQLSSDSSSSPPT